VQPLLLPSARTPHLVLWGPPAVGKSTLGRLVAERLNRRFADLDTQIASEVGISIAELFAERGEPAFRSLERSALSTLLDARDPLVLAVGGGALVDPPSRALALRRALVVGLTAPIEVLVRRLGKASTPRPLLAGPHDAPATARLEALLAERREAYADAHWHQPTEPGSLTATADAIAELVRRGTVGISTRSASYAVIPTRHPAQVLTTRLETMAPTRVGVVLDRGVGARGHELVEHLRRLELPLDVFELEPRETEKSLATVERLLHAFASWKLDRASVIVAIGGGITSDLAGFSASLFARGVRWIAVPTTTLSMVDAAVGGKTGANLGPAKNLVGSFHQPSCVVIDPTFSRTESPRARRSGLTEVVKSALLDGVDAFEALERNAEELRDGVGHALEEAALAGVRTKARVVEADPEERGLRATLNLGHTFGHAFEAVGSYTTWTHGEAVAMGLVVALAIGVALDVTPRIWLDRTVALLHALELPTWPEDALLQAAVPLLSGDKKRFGERIHFVLLATPGRCLRVPIAPDSALELARLGGARMHEVAPVARDLLG
jgi:shikimate kinase/3-dehydroquinate synthase